MWILSIALAILMTVALMAVGAPPIRRADSLGSVEAKAMHFLQQFGYLRGDQKQSRNAQDTKSAIAAYQRRSGLRTTGSLTRETIQQMAKPRCGVPDVGLGVRNRFNLGDGKWYKLQLIYRISMYQNSGSMKNFEVDQVIKRAFQMWSEVTDFTFRPFDQMRDVRPDIDIRFLKYTHGKDVDDEAFDGPEGVLGHAFFPTDGRVHFDASEQWTMGEGTNLLQVAVHEFGHALGLAHSDDMQSVMATPFVFRPDFRLTHDDIQGVRMLYNGEYMEDNPSYKRIAHQRLQKPSRLERPTFSQRPPKTFSQRKHPTHGIVQGRFGGGDNDDDDDDKDEDEDVESGAVNEATETKSTAKSYTKSDIKSATKSTTSTTATTTTNNFVLPV